MKRLLLLGSCILIPFLALEAQEQSGPMPTTTPRQMMAREVQVKIDILSGEESQTGLTADEIKGMIIQQLEAAGISTNETIEQPLLVLRIRSLQVGFDMATFFQLNLLEEAMLIRNRSIFQATTWSQASLLSCRPEDLRKEILDTVTMMVQSFAKDFTNAIPASSK